MTIERWSIPNQWVWCSAAEVAMIVGGGTPSTKITSYFAQQGIPWIGPADLTNYTKTYIERGRRDLSELGYAKSGATMLPAGSVLFSSRAPIGYCAIAANSLCTNQGFKSWVCENGVSPEFVRYYLLASVDYVDSLASGTTFREVSAKRVESISIPLPPTDEQRRIVAKLDVLTARIARARVELDRVPHLAKRLKEMAVEVALVPSSKIGELPAGWSAKELGSILLEGPSNGWSPKSGSDAQGALTLKLTATTSGRLRLDDAAVKRIYETPARGSPFWLRDGDLLVQRGNSLEHVGVAAIFDGPPNTYIYPDLMMRLRFSDPLLTRLVWYRINSPSARQYLRDRATGTAGNMPKISGVTVRQMPIAIPPQRLWAKIVKALDSAFARSDSLEAEATRARALLDRLEAAILAKAFKGELVPQDPNDEPASVLLDRIRSQRTASSKPKPKQGRQAKVRSELGIST